MLGKTHKYVGACTGIIATQQIVSSPLTPEKIIFGSALISGSIIGSLILDIDKQGTTMGKKFPTFAKICNILFGHRGATHAPLIIAFLCLGLLYLNTIMNENIRIIFLGTYCTLVFYSFLKFLLRKIKLFKKKYVVFYKIISFFISVASCIYLYTLGIEFLSSLFIFIVIGLFFGAMSHILLDSFNPTGTPWFYPFSKKKHRILKLSEKYGFGFSIIFTILVLLSTYSLFI